MTTDNNSGKKVKVRWSSNGPWTDYDRWMWRHPFWSRFIILIEGLLITFILNLIFQWESMNDILKFMEVAFIVGTCWCLWAKFVIWFKGP